jgi:hypothetical protein
MRRTRRTGNRRPCGNTPGHGYQLVSLRSLCLIFDQAPQVMSFLFVLYCFLLCHRFAGDPVASLRKFALSTAWIARVNSASFYRLSHARACDSGAVPNG